MERNSLGQQPLEVFVTTYEEFSSKQTVIELSGVGYRPMKIAYTDDGEGDVIVMLHGIPTWSYLYNRVVPYLSPNVRVICPDLIGYGNSDQRDCFDRSIRAQAKMVAALLDALGIEKATVLGHDIGGGAALVFAIDYPERLEKLVLTNIVAYHTWPNAGMIELGDPFWVEREPADVVKFARERNFAGYDQPEIDVIFQPYMSKTGMISLIRNASGLSTNHTMELVDLHSTIKARTLLLWGAKDEWQEPWIADRLTQEIPDTKLVKVPSAGHWIQFDEPEIFAREIAAFMQE